MAIRVTDNQDSSRFEIFDDEELAGFAEYHRYGTELAFIHTEVDPKFEGHGLASRLIGETLDEARRRGLEVMPYCPFVRKYIARHEAYLDLVPTEHRDKFGL